MPGIFFKNSFKTSSLAFNVYCISTTRDSIMSHKTFPSIDTTLTKNTKLDVFGHVVVVVVADVASSMWFTGIGDN